MMTTPTVAQLVTVIRGQLSTVVAPALEDEGLRKLMGIIDHLLQTVAVRADHEIDWMVSHTNKVVALAQNTVDDDVAPAAVGDALQRFYADRQSTLETSAVTANYALAAEVLSALLESTIDDDGPVGRATRELLHTDIERGVQIVGEFELIPP
jgi:hypothetical protein